MLSNIVVANTTNDKIIVRLSFIDEWDNTFTIKKGSTKQEIADILRQVAKNLDDDNGIIVTGNGISNEK